MEAITVIWIVAAFAWLAIGGWALTAIGRVTKESQMGTAFMFCLLLAPFAAGMVISDKQNGQRKVEE